VHGLVADLDQFSRGLEALNQGDVETFLEGMHPEIEFIPRRAPVQGAYHGHDGLIRFEELGDRARALRAAGAEPRD
jgi:hypothetical protein